MKKIKNATQQNKIWMGQQVLPGEYYQLQPHEEFIWANDPGVQGDVSAGNLVVNDGSADIVNVSDALAHLQSTASYIQNIILRSNNKEYIEVTSSSYAAIAQLIFPGTRRSALNKILATCHLGGGTGMKIRIYNITDATVICERLNIINGTAAIVDLGPLSNLPAAQATFEIQVASMSMGDKARCSSVLLRS